ESNYTPYTDTGIFSVYFGTEPEKMETAARLVHKEFKKLREHPLSAVQLKQSKNKFIGQVALGEENRMGLIIAMAKNILDYGQVESLEESYQRIEGETYDSSKATENEIRQAEHV